MIQTPGEVMLRRLLSLPDDGIVVVRSWKER